MKTYLLDTIERFKRYSKKMDVKTILCSKAWYVLNEDGDTENLIFQEDGTVLVSVNGTLKKYTWLYIPQNQSLSIMHTDTDGTMLKPAYLDDKVLAFQKIGTKECMFLIDDAGDQITKINTLFEVKNYLLQIEQAEEGKKLALKAAEQKKKEEEERRLQVIKQTESQKIQAEKVAQKNEEIEHYKQRLRKTQEKIVIIQNKIDVANEELTSFVLIKDKLALLAQNSDYIKTKRIYQRKLKIARFFEHDNTKAISILFFLMVIILIMGLIDMGSIDNLYWVSLLIVSVIIITLIIAFNFDKVINSKKTESAYMNYVCTILKEQYGINIQLDNFIFTNTLELDETYVYALKEKLHREFQPTEVKLLTEVEQLNIKLKKLQTELSKIAKVKSLNVYVCECCGYIYDPSVGDEISGISAYTSWENVPADYSCPFCEKGKESFLEEEKI